MNDGFSLPVGTENTIPDKLYTIKSINVDKIVFDVFNITDKNIRNDLSSTRVLKLGEPSGTLNIRATSEVIAMASMNIGRIVCDIRIDTNIHKHATLVGMELVGDII